MVIGKIEVNREDLRQRYNGEPVVSLVGNTTVEAVRVIANDKSEFEIRQ